MPWETRRLATDSNDEKMATMMKITMVTMLFIVMIAVRIYGTNFLCHLLLISSNDKDGDDVLRISSSQLHLVLVVVVVI